MLRKIKKPTTGKHKRTFFDSFSFGRDYLFSVSLAIPRHGFILENKVDSLAKETPHSKVYNPIVCGREQTCTLFTLISEKLADFIIAVIGNRIECELCGVGIRSVLRI